MGTSVTQFTLPIEDKTSASVDSSYLDSTSVALMTTTCISDQHDNQDQQQSLSGTLEELKTPQYDSFNMDNLVGDGCGIFKDLVNELYKEIGTTDICKISVGSVEDLVSAKLESAQITLSQLHECGYQNQNEAVSAITTEFYRGSGVAVP